MATFFKNDETGKFLAAIDADMVAPAGYTEVVANSVDAATEKHVPVIDVQREGHVLNVTVGEVEHPMEAEHYIEWIALEAAGRLEVHYLKPGQAPHHLLRRRGQDRYRLRLLQPSRPVEG